jgi:hypothetical protein
MLLAMAAMVAAAAQPASTSRWRTVASRERLLERAREAGQEALDKGQRIVIQAVTSVREGVQEAAANADPRGRRAASKPS